MAIFLVRHGETAGNATRVVQHPEAPLSARGFQQAAQLADRLFSLGFVHVLCSDLPRARMTAEPLRARGGAVIEETALLQERDFGDLRGRRHDELTQDPFAPGFLPPNGESDAVFHHRVSQAFALIVERRRGLAGSLVVVTHGLVCHTILQRHARPDVVPDHIANTGLTVLDPDPPFAARLVNCTQHLAEDAAS
jgi:probable phosphoglycerate mutase